MMSLWDALRMNMMISYQELVRTFPISAELVQMRALQPEQWVKPLAITSDAKPILNARHDGHVWRRVPEPHRLLTENGENVPS